VSGVVITLFIAWGLPIMLAARGSGAWGAPSLQWFGSPDFERPGFEWHGLERPGEGVRDPNGIGIDIPATIARTPTVDVRRGVLSDWYVARRSESGANWPTGILEELLFEHTLDPLKRTPPSYVVVTPPPSEVERFARIDTGVAGWPFRAFAGEAWYRAANNGIGHEEMPELRDNRSLGLVNGQLLLVPHRPLWLGILGDVVFWSSLSWAVVAFPLAIRRRRREKYGKCTGCGYAMDAHAVKRPERCPECGAAFARDPLGFVRSPEMHFQNAYVWFVFISSLDIMLTWKILNRGGMEVNPLAAVVIDAWGMYGAIAFKFALMMWVIVACELLARLRQSAGRMLVTAAVVISAMPVAWSLFLLVMHEFFPE